MFKMKVRITDYPNCRIGITLNSKFNNVKYRQPAELTRNFTPDEARDLISILHTAIEAASKVPPTEWRI